MKNNKKNDKLYVNEITDLNTTQRLSNKSVGTADEEQFCVYANNRHAVGSKIKTNDGSEKVCTEKGSWDNKK